MGVILDIAPKITVVGGGGGTADVDLTDVYQKIDENKSAIGENKIVIEENKTAIGSLTDLSTNDKTSLVGAVNEMKNDLNNKANLARVEAIERYILSLEERLSKIDIEFLDPASILFLD